MSLTAVDDGNARALLAGTSCSSASVGVALNVIGHTIVYHVCKIIHVQSACRHVGGDEQLGEMLAELLHGEVALLLAQVAVQALCVVSVAYQQVGNLLCFNFRAAEHDGVNLRVEVNDALQCQIFVLGVHHIIYVVHVFRTLVSRPHHYLLVLFEIAFGNAFNLTAHCGREKQRLAVVGDAFEYGVDALRESHVEHLVRLVKHHAFHAVHLCHLSVYEVYQSSRGGDYHLRPFLQRAYLTVNRRTAVDSHDMYAVDVFGK